MVPESGTPLGDENAPLASLEDWERFVAARCGHAHPAEEPEDYRNHDSPARDTVRDFYGLNHRHQACGFVRQKRRQFLSLDRAEMSPWQALECLNRLVDDSDPDIALTQSNPFLQTAEPIRANGHPDWLVLTGLIHDLGKVLCLFGEPQWALVGDTFPVGCRFSQ